MELAYVSKAVGTVTKEIFSTMISLPVNQGDMYEPSSSADHKFDYTGIIGLSGEFTGAVGVRFSKNLAGKIAAKMLGMSEEEAANEIRDTVGELTNMIAGGLKNELDKVKICFDIAIPTVIAGDQHTFNVMGDASGVAIPFTVEEGNFVVEVSLKKKGD